MCAHCGTAFTPLFLGSCSVKAASSAAPASFGGTSPNAVSSVRMGGSVFISLVLFRRIKPQQKRLRQATMASLLFLKMLDLEPRFTRGLDSKLSIRLPKPYLYCLCHLRDGYPGEQHVGS